jgi:hypothetical protein
MLHAGLDLSRRRLDVCLHAEHGELVAEIAVPADADGLRGLAGRLAGRRVRAVTCVDERGAVRARARGARLGGCCLKVVTNIYADIVRGDRLVEQMRRDPANRPRTSVSGYVAGSE